MKLRGKQLSRRGNRLDPATASVEIRPVLNRRDITSRIRYDRVERFKESIKFTVLAPPAGPLIRRERQGQAKEH